MKRQPTEEFPTAEDEAWMNAPMGTPTAEDLAGPAYDPRSERGGMSDDDCKHPTLVSYSGPEGPMMWGCARCSRRFYPACRECVTLGHRGGHGEHRPDPLLKEAVPA